MLCKLRGILPKQNFFSKQNLSQKSVKKVFFQKYDPKDDRESHGLLKKLFHHKSDLTRSIEKILWEAVYYIDSKFRNLGDFQ